MVRAVITAQRHGVASLISGLSPASPPLAYRIALNCSFEYAVDFARLDSDVRTSEADGSQITKWASVVLAVLASMRFVILLRMDRAIGEAYMAATRRPQRERTRRKHEMLRKRVIGATIVVFVFAGLHGSAALYGMAFQSFLDARALFVRLMLMSIVIGFTALGFSWAFLYDHIYGVHAY